MLIYSFCQAQVILLMRKKTGIPTKYSDFSNILSLNSATKLPEYTGINDYPIDLLNNKQPPYSSIYSLGQVELEILKIYIEANVASGFIRSFKFLTCTLILFIQKKDGSFRLCVDYQRLNNLIIKNCYPLPLIGESLDCLGHTKRFT